MGQTVNLLSQMSNQGMHNSLQTYAVSGSLLPMPSTSPYAKGLSHDKGIEINRLLIKAYDMIHKYENFYNDTNRRSELNDRLDNVKRWAHSQWGYVGVSGYTGSVGHAGFSGYLGHAGFVGSIGGALGTSNVNVSNYATSLKECIPKTHWYEPIKYEPIKYESIKHMFLKVMFVLGLCKA